MNDNYKVLPGRLIGGVKKNVKKVKEYNTKHETKLVDIAKLISSCEV